MEEKDGSTEPAEASPQASPKASGDGASIDKTVSDDFHPGSDEATSQNCDNSPSDIKSVSTTEPAQSIGSPSELQNHVDHDSGVDYSEHTTLSAHLESEVQEANDDGEEADKPEDPNDSSINEDELLRDPTEDSNDVKTTVEDEGTDKNKKEDNVDNTTEDSSQGPASQETVSEDTTNPTEETEGTEEPKQELEESQDDDQTFEKEENDSTQEELEQSIDAKERSTESVDDSKIESEDRKNDNPEFESAPPVTDDSQDDHSQALDPFDALLKDKSDNDVTSATQTSTTAASVNTDDDDDHNADDIVDGGAEDDSHAEDHQPGEDEEVCLLPDTEREISEADKAEAEKVLAEKRKQAEEAASAAVALKEENDGDAESAGRDETLNSEETEGHVNEDAVGETSQENGADKDQEEENEEAEPETEDVSSNVIQQITPTSRPCLNCKASTCTYRLTKDGETKYLCKVSCVNQFVGENPLYTVVSRKYVIEEIAPKEMTCSECEEEKFCYFFYNYDGEDTQYCSEICLQSMMADEQHLYSYRRRKIYVSEREPEDAQCFVCNVQTKCIFNMRRFGDDLWVCSQPCIKALNDTENGRYIIIKLKLNKIKGQAAQAQTTNPPLLKLKVISNATDKYLDEAYKIQAKTPAMVQAAREERDRTFLRHCMQCSLLLEGDDKMLTWETMDFCNEICLGRYQNKIGSRCANCKNPVQHTSLGKYCVRFGYDIRQFCNSSCLEEFKKGLKICCYCQKDISVGHQGFLAPVGDKGQFKDFCSQVCMEKFDHMSKNPVPQPVWAKCAVCSMEKDTTIEVEVGNNVFQRLCSDPCFAAFKFVNNIFPDQCRWCKIYFERKLNKFYTIYDGTTPNCFCSKSCMNVYISNTRHIVPCNWCKVKKYNFDMIKRVQLNGQQVMMCSLNCLNLYQVSVNAVSSRRTKCDMCKRTALAQYHLTMSDATVRNFCTYPCVMNFQSQYSKQASPVVAGQENLDQSKAVPTGAPRRTVANSKNNGQENIEQPKTPVTRRTYSKSNASQKSTRSSGLPVISNVQSLATPPPLQPAVTRGKSKRHAVPPTPEPEPIQAPPSPPPPPKPVTPPPPPPPKVYNHVIVKTLPPREIANKGTMTKPMMVSKGVSCRPHPCTKECQTDPSLERRVLIPVPVPIYVPVPCAMWSLPFPVPVPIPLPVPTPVFIPTTRNSAKGIMKEINKIHDKMPTDPFEAELLMMAEMVAGDKKKDQSDSETDEENEESFSPVAGIDGNHAFGEDMLQMALKMATEYEDQPVDLESAMTANTITPSSHPGMPGLEGEPMHQHHLMLLEQQRAAAARAAGRKRVPPPPPRPRSKRRRPEPAPPPEPPREPAEKPDANMCLKYTFGVNAWKQWVMTKNAEIEKSSIRRKPFKSEILQLTADELNYSLCLFVKEVRKPNGSEYAPDTIYYLVLGIQQYLFENGRIDNIFTDPYYEKFTDCLDEVARKFSVLYNDSQYIVTRVEEEHLWESKQLGAHSPHVLLSTLMFFNTKHFNLVTVEEHMQLSFSHIMKHWKRNPNQPGQAKVPGSRNVLLRFYPPQSALEANSRKKKVYEQQENEENPLRCPVKLYEFYISKCPESVRTRNDVFYLQPERSCVPDSPVWYSTQPLSRAALAKMLHRVKMVKEINIALLTS